MITTATTPKLDWIANYICGMAGDALRGIYVRGRYLEVVRPRTGLLRIDAAHEPAKCRVGQRIRVRLDDKQCYN